MKSICSSFLRPRLVPLLLCAALWLQPALRAQEHCPSTPSPPQPQPQPEPITPAPYENRPITGTDATDRMLQEKLDKGEEPHQKPPPSTAEKGGHGSVALDLQKEISQPAQRVMYSSSVIQQCALDSEELHKALAAHARKIAKGYRDLAKGAREHAKTLSNPDNRKSREKDADDWDKIADDYDKQAGDDDRKADDARKRAEKAAEEERQRKEEAERQERERTERARKAAEEKARAEQAEREARRAKFEKELKEKADKAEAERRAARQEAERQARAELEQQEKQAEAEREARKAAFQASGKLAESTGGKGGSVQGKKPGEREVSGTGETFAKEGFEIGTKGAAKITAGHLEKGGGKALGAALEGAVDGAFTVKDVVEFGKAAQEVVNKGSTQRQEVSDNIDKWSDPKWKPKPGETATSGSLSWGQTKENAAKLVGAAPLPKF